MYVCFACVMMCQSMIIFDNYLWMLHKEIDIVKSLSENILKT